MTHYTDLKSEKKTGRFSQKSGWWAVGRGVAMAVLGIAATTACSGIAAAVTYTFTDLGSVDGPLDGGLGIDSTGDVAGSLGNRAAVSIGGATLSPFGPTNGSVTSANAINNGGVIVGGGIDGNPSSAFYAKTSNLTSTYTSLPTFGGGSDAALAVNGNASVFEVVGRSALSGGNDRAFKWSSSSPGSLTPLGPTLTDTGIGGSGDGAASVATGVNSAGSIVGQATNSNGDSHAFFYSLTGTMYDLGVESGAAAGSDASIAYAINNSGVIVGQSDTSGSFTGQAFTYDGYNTATVSSAGGSDLQLNGTYHGLGSLDGPTGTSEALAINSNGIVVGDSSADGGNAQDAFVYMNGTLSDLNNGSLVTLPSGDTLVSATGINDAGDITGYGLDKNGNRFAFELAPSATVPEPASMGILITGIAALSTRRRKM